jgi:hypothetical protein
MATTRKQIPPTKQIPKKGTTKGGWSPTKKGTMNGPLQPGRPRRSPPIYLPPTKGGPSGNRITPTGNRITPTGTRPIAANTLTASQVARLSAAQKAAYGKSGMRTVGPGSKKPRRIVGTVKQAKANAVKAKRK